MITKHGTSKLVKYFTGQVYGAQALYLGLCAADKLDITNLTAVEPTASTYHRVQLSNGTSSPSANDNVFVGSDVSYEADGVTAVAANRQIIYFPDNTNPNDETDIQAWGTMHYALLFSAATGGQLLGYTELPKDIPVTASTAIVPLVRIGKLKFKVGNLAV